MKNPTQQLSVVEDSQSLKSKHKCYAAEANRREAASLHIGPPEYYLRGPLLKSF